MAGSGMGGLTQRPSLASHASEQKAPRAGNYPAGALSIPENGHRAREAPAPSSRHASGRSVLGPTRRVTKKIGNAGNFRRAPRSYQA